MLTAIIFLIGGVYISAGAYIIYRLIATRKMSDRDLFPELDPHYQELN